MCGRYVLDDDLGEDMLLDEILDSQSFEAASRDLRGEICPGMDAPAIVADGGNRALRTLRWGFASPSGGALIINARGETMWEKPIFRDSAQNRRCLLPASGYYEWRTRDRLKFRVSRIGGGGLLLAGLWRTDGRFVVVTEPSRGAMAAIHPRMPVALWDAEICMKWLMDPEAAREHSCHGDGSGLGAVPQGPEQLRMTL